MKLYEASQRSMKMKIIFFFSSGIGTGRVNLPNHHFNFIYPQPFKQQLHEMVKHTQTIRRLWPTNCLSVFDHFMGSALKGLRAKHIEQ